MELTKLLALIEESPGYIKLLAEIGLKEQIPATALSAAKPYLIAALHHKLGVPVLVVTAQPENAGKLYEQLLSWAGPDVKLLPEPDTLPYEHVTAESAAELERVQVLSTLVNCPSGEAPLVVASAAAIMSQVPPYSDFAGACYIIKPGIEIEPLELLGRWEKLGYRFESAVEVPGTMSHRGGIVDVYPPTSEYPVRLEFFGNTIESLRSFDPATQRSVKSIASLVVTPATEMLAPLLQDKSEVAQVLDSLDISNCLPEVQAHLKEEITMLASGQRPRNAPFYAPLFNHDSLLAYLPPQAIIVLDEPRAIQQAIETLDGEARELRTQKLERGELPRNYPQPYFVWEELAPLMQQRKQLWLSSFGAEETTGRLRFTSASSYNGRLPAFLDKTKELLQSKSRVIITSYQASRLAELLEQADIFASPVAVIKEPPAPGTLTLVQGSLSEGWVLEDTTYLFTDAELFGFVKQRRLAKRRPASHRDFLVDISPGDYVVHVEHGVGLFQGITKMGGDGNQKEYLVLQYAAGDKLYVPTDQIDRVSRYIGGSDKIPVLSRLGTQEWSRAKEKAKEAAEAMARELLELYATRELVPGFAFSRDTVWQQELEASFPYVETPDQLEAQRKVKEDMQLPKPMDRLVCGDVGYGKTEVAIRAAFKAVMDGKQVAVLVPTTVLAEQHYRTFSERMEAFPVRIEVLSRFKSAREQKATLEGLASGSVDICIGTHRLIQKDVIFKDLGLLIIDEEQRFGVAHKEYLKKMRQEVDVLTLSATPIPRTLHMSLVGVRDMSVMETPPENRQPIKTYIAAYDELLVREAILRELERNGQVFFIHNRVQSIAIVASRLKELVPEARIAVGHGQMPEEKLEAVMAEFARGDKDVLVCTTIIESGLDMPNVNTLIINDADKFGLTQLYQLRGRVGRGAHRAYAYFLYDGKKMLTPTAEKRLQTIFEATELGAGYSIAMKDLEIRGAGTLLGQHQSGYISALGFNLYCRLLAEAVEEQRAKLGGAKESKPPRLPPPTIDLPLTAFIPEEYVMDVSTRLGLYQRLVKTGTLAEVEALARELNDRFGPLPDEVSNLLYIVRLKLGAAKAGIESVSSENGQIVLRRFHGRPFDGQKLAKWQNAVKVGVTQLALEPKLVKDWQRTLAEVVEKCS